MKDILLLIFLIAFGLFVLYRIFVTVKEDFLHIKTPKKKTGSAKRANPRGREEIILIDIDDEI